MVVGTERGYAAGNQGIVFSWGYDGYGQLGDGSNMDRNVPVKGRSPQGGGNLDGIVAVSGGGYHTVALKSDGTVWSWGYNLYGALGDGSTTDRYIPVQVLGTGGVGNLTGIVGIGGGGYHTVAINGASRN